MKKIDKVRLRSEEMQYISHNDKILWQQQTHPFVLQFFNAHNHGGYRVEEKNKQAWCFHLIPYPFFHVLCTKEKFDNLFFILSNFTVILFLEAIVNSWLNYYNDILFIGLLVYNFSILLSIEKYSNICITSLSIQFLPPTRFMFFKLTFIILANSLLQTKC